MTVQPTESIDENRHPGAEAAASECPVNSFNEWDPLEEVIVGRLDYATIPSNHIAVTFNVPRWKARLLSLAAGRHYPRIMTEPAQKELDEFIRILEVEGVRVRRPDVVDFKRRFSTPHFKARGFTTACPRDGFLVIGNEIIETPMAWRTRHFEPYAYRSLFKEYFQAGARWTAAPRPELADELYERAPDHLKPLYDFSRTQPREHRKVVKRFGRHPHRNAILGRESTEEELTFLAGPGAPF